MVDLALLRVTRDEPARTAMQRIQKSGAGLALVLDGTDHLQGTISDGDLRTAILGGVDLETPISRLLVELERLQGHPRRPPVTAPRNATRAQLLSLMAGHGVRQVPLVDDDGRVVGCSLQGDLIANAAPDVTAVVMAGGRGTRLAPLTDTTPKPMLPVGGKPLLERTLENLRQAGVREVSIATHYLHDVFERHFGDGHSMGMSLRYLQENQPLGTAGALSLLPSPSGPFLVMNGDILTDLDVRALVDFHGSHGAELTVCVRRFQFKVPYGVLDVDGTAVTRLTEKPSFSLFVNAGIYLLEPEVLSLIPRERRFDMTELIGLLLSQRRKVVSFPVHEYWLDIGQPADYARAVDDVGHGVI